MTLAKGLGNGVPIGACLARGAAAEVLRPRHPRLHLRRQPAGLPRRHGPCWRPSNASDLVDQAARLGDHTARRPSARPWPASPGVRDIRGRGLMLGIELDRPCAELVGQALEAGLLINVTAERVIRLLPPLILERDQVELLVDQLARLIAAFLATPAPKPARRITRPHGPSAPA